jgi:hypothetical protein
MAGIFQVAADLWSLGFSVCIVLSFLHNFPTAKFISAKSYRDTLEEMTWRGHIQTLFLILALAFLGCWIAFSERLKEVLQDTSLLDIDNIHDVSKPNSAIWTLVQIVFDFFGKSVIAKLCFCDLLLQMAAHTELADPTPQQQVMREEVHILYSIGDLQATRSPEPKLRFEIVDGELNTEGICVDEQAQA